MSRHRRLLEALSVPGATDLHLKPGSPPRVRRKGVLEAMPGEAIMTRAEVEDLALAVLGACGPAALLDGGIAATHAVDGVGRFRVRAYRQRGSVALIIRRIPDTIETLSTLGLPDQVAGFAEIEHGLVLVAGPPHSGRRRTLASMLDHVNRVRAAHIVAVEQPVELLHRDAMGSVSQLEVGTDVRSFGEGVQAALHADADVVVVSDIADPDTAAGVLTGAEDGLLVLAGIEALSGVDALRGFIELFPFERRDAVRLSLAGLLRGTVAQRLAPRAAGSGRVPVVEIVIATSAVCECLFDADTLGAIDGIVARGDDDGMQSFVAATTALMNDGAVDLRGALTVIDDWSALHQALEASGYLAR
jgi:twitching motility protein PilT